MEELNFLQKKKISTFMIQLKYLRETRGCFYYKLELTFEHISQFLVSQLISEEVADSAMGQTASRIKDSSTPSESTGPYASSVPSIHSTDSGSFPLGVQTATPRRPLSSKRSHELFEADEANKTEAVIPSKKAKEHLLYLDYPFFNDIRTKDYIKNSKIMFIMKGISGSGKSTVANTIRDTFPHSYHSADAFFNKTGEYIFEFEKLKEAHQFCQKGSIEEAEKHQNVIIIDNTNVRNWEMKLYLDLAKMYQYVVIVVEPKTPWYKDAEELAKKNQHGVSEEIIMKKVKMYQEPCPLYYGWFVNETDSITLLEIGKNWLKNALEELPYFFTDFSAQSGKLTKEEMINYFTRESFYHGNSMLHCTAMFTGRGSQPDAKEYMKKQEVVDSLGKYFELNIIGFVITPRTLGARIQLSTDQLELWNQNDAEETPDYIRIYPQKDQGNKGNKQKNNNDDSAEVTIPEYSEHKREFDCVGTIKEVDQDLGQNRFNPTFGKGSRAHITNGCASNVRPVTTGLDIIDTVCAEQIYMTEASENGESLVKSFKISGAVLRQYENGLWVVYPDKKVIVGSIFSGAY
ncbi:unnamed protein product, partial [Meganyctiphanes norvegica]